MASKARGSAARAEAPRRSIRRVVAFYKLIRETEQPRLFDRTFDEYMTQALNPDHIVLRYRREWRLSAPRHRDNWIVGKLGFLQPTVEAKLGYDEKTHDFIPHQEPAEDVSFSHYVISPDDALLAFEVKPPQIRPQSFVGALQALLRAGGTPYRLSAVPDPQSFDEWRASVDRVTELSITAVVPNPSTSRPKNLVKKLASMNANRVSIRAFSERKDGLNLLDPLLQEAIGHVTSGYGSEKARGLNHGKISRFDSEAHVRITTIEANSDDSTEQVFAEIITVVKRVKGEL